jgi:hypothetical protein
VTPTIRPPGWSKTTEVLVRSVAEGCRPRLRLELARWVESRPRFGAWLRQHQAKVHKKLASARDEEARLDVRAELLVAYLLLGDQRFDVAVEAYGAGQRGPDLTVTYREQQRFNLEVTRLRSAARPEDVPAAAGAPADGADRQRSHVEPARLATVIASKLRQLRAELPNALLITGRELSVSEETLLAAVRLLMVQAGRGNHEFFARCGLKDASGFHAHFVRLGGVFVLDEADGQLSSILVANPDARHPLPREALDRLSACLNSEAGV